MKAIPFDSTPEFQRFKDVMRGVIAVPKLRLSELVESVKEESPRKGNPHAAGRKRTKWRSSSRKKRSQQANH